MSPIKTPAADASADEATLFAFDDVAIPFTHNLRLSMRSPRKHPANPVLPRGEPGTPDEFGVQFYGAILRDGGTFRMWYVALIIFFGSVLAGVPTLVRAQSSPVDLTELSIYELMDIEVKKLDALAADQEPIRFGYRYLRSQFKDYRDGTERTAAAAVLGPLGSDTYPIVQTEITQQAHLFDVGYDINETWSVNLVFPYIKQSTDHISTVPDFDFFIIDSEGVGDVVITGAYHYRLGAHNVLQLAAGLSVPTGSIDETGDTPSPGPANTLPYTMQLGSGTWDLPLSLTYRGQSGALPLVRHLVFGGRGYGMVRMGENDADYRLGHRLTLMGWLEVRPLSWLEPQMLLSAEFWGKVKGKDGRLPGPPAPAFFPTPVVNPEFYGGKKILVQGGAKLQWPEDFLKGWLGDVMARQSLRFKVGVPVYQKLNGPQKEEDWRIQLSWGISLPRP